MMKIDPSINPINPGKPEGVSSTERNARRSDTVGEGASKDRAELSERARVLGKARLAFEQASDVRSEKVRVLKEQVDSGTYQIPYNELAQALLKRIGLK